MTSLPFFNFTVFSWLFGFKWRNLISEYCYTLVTTKKIKQIFLTYWGSQGKKSLRFEVQMRVMNFWLASTNSSHHVTNSPAHLSLVWQWFCVYLNLFRNGYNKINAQIVHISDWKENRVSMVNSQFTLLKLIAWKD